MARAYFTSYRMPVIITRSNNVYGPGQFPEKLSERVEGWIAGFCRGVAAWRPGGACVPC